MPAIIHLFSSFVDLPASMVPPPGKRYTLIAKQIKAVFASSFGYAAEWSE
jgi:hypothetical protein